MILDDRAMIDGVRGEVYSQLIESKLDVFIYTVYNYFLHFIIIIIIIIIVVSIYNHYYNYYE